MRIVHVSSEVSPFSKTGGLADVSGALPAALDRAGHEVSIITPRYDSVQLDPASTDAPALLQGLRLEIGGREIGYSVLRSALPGSDVPVFLIDCPSAFARGSIYTNDDDEHLRFALLQRAALETLQHLGESPDVIHAHDWQTALLPLYLRTIYGWDRLFRDTRTVLTIHNLGYQGVFGSEAVAETGLAGSAQSLHQQELAAGRFSFLTTGIMYADVLTTVSPTYARQILTPEAGVGLDQLLRERPGGVTGILNGIDGGVWNPRSDRHLSHRYSVKSLWRKEKNKESLLEALGLSYEKRVPVLGLVARLTWQKGIDLMQQVLPEVLASHDVRLVALGSGERKHMDWFERLQATFPDRVAYRSGYDEPLAHRIEAAADIFLMPSLYEPCGLNQMYSLAYGTVPVVHRTGGLADSVSLFDPDTGAGNGVVFDHPTATGFRWGVETALGLHSDAATWKGLVANGMAADNSWDRRVADYEQVYGARKAAVA